MNAPACLQEDRLRANFYSLLATLLARPPIEATLRLLDGIQAGAEADVNLANCWQRLRAEAACGTAGQFEEEFNRLFIGLGRGEVVPYASWYLAGRLLDKPLARLRGDLAILGIERRPENRETEDHAAALCETMALISDPGQGMPRDRQQHFYRRHLSCWMPRFFSDLQTAPAARFYKAVGHMGEAFLALETIYLDQAQETAPPPQWLGA
jgi:TorA maturation chaperone TorD